MFCHGSSAGAVHYMRSLSIPKWAREEMTGFLRKAFDTGEFTDILRFIKQHRSFIDFYIPDCGTTIVAAVQHGRRDIVEKLLEMGADPLVFNGYSLNGPNVFNVAKKPHQLPSMEYILAHTSEWQEKSSVKALTTAFRKALEDVWETGDFTRIDIYLRYRQDLINTSFEHGTLLSCAHKFESLERVKQYMAMGADPWDGKTNPFQFEETLTQSEILKHICDDTKVFQAGELWDYWS